MNSHYSKTIYYMKALAILLVIAAHVTEVSEYSISVKIISSIWKEIGYIGVIIFFVWAGYFSQNFRKERILKLLIPWCFAGGITYMVEIILNNNFELLGYVKWIIGYKTFFYYLSIYCFFMLISKLLWKKDNILLGGIYLSIGYVILETSIDITLLIPDIYVATYLNPLNWYIFFSAGILIKKRNLEDKLFESNKKQILWIFMIWLILLSTLILFDIYTYFNFFAVAFEMVSFIIISKICYAFNLSGVVQKIAMFIGRNTLFVYLFHIQIVQFVCHRIPNEIIKVTISPVVGLFVMAMLAYIIKRITERNETLKRIARTLLVIN